MNLTIDLRDEEVISSPHPVYNFLRENDPVHWNASIKGWVVTRHDDAREVLRDPRFSVEKLTPFVNQMHGQTRAKVEVLADTMKHWLPFMEPPTHTRMRKVLQRGFMPRRIAALEDFVQATVTRLLDNVADKGRMDVIEDFAYPLPTVVIGAMFGVPLEDSDKLRNWSLNLGKFVLGGTPGPDKYDSASEAIELMRVYFRELVEEHKKAPRDNITSSMVETIGKPDGMTEDEVIASLVLILFAGHETTANLIGNAILSLIRNKPQLERLQGDLSLLPRAVEEFLRFESSAHLIVRVAKEDVEIRGRKIGKDQRLFIVLNAADRDSSQFDFPDQLDVTRQKNPHIAFGYGLHSCLGQPLARIEAITALRGVLERFDNLELAIDDSELRWHSEILVHGVKSLPITFRKR